jgi:Antitoxin ParD
VLWCQEKEEAIMPRISIDVSDQQHQRLKAFAALRGQTIKDYVLEQTLPPEAEDDSISEVEALHQLETFLKPRIEAAERGEVVNRSVTQIFEDARNRAAH